MFFSSFLFCFLYYLKEKHKIAIVYTQNNPIDSNSNELDNKENKKENLKKTKEDLKDSNIMLQKLPDTLDKKYTNQKRKRENNEQYDITDMNNFTKKLIEDQTVRDNEESGSEDEDIEYKKDSKNKVKEKPNMNFKNIKQKTNLNLEASSNFIEKSNIIIILIFRFL